MNTFGWAIEQLKAGLKVRRESWDIGCYLFIKHDFIHIDKPWFGNPQIYRPTFEMLEEDWEVYE